MKIAPFENYIWPIVFVFSVIIFLLWVQKKKDSQEKKFGNLTYGVEIFYGWSISKVKPFFENLIPDLGIVSFFKGIWQSIKKIFSDL